MPEPRDEKGWPAVRDFTMCLWAMLIGFTLGAWTMANNKNIAQIRHNYDGSLWAEIHGVKYHLFKQEGHE
jgi:hypothetical protein